jgi:hypothetical protein
MLHLCYYCVRFHALQHMTDLLQQVIDSCGVQYEECMNASTSSSSSSAAKQKARQRALDMEKQALAAH